MNNRNRLDVMISRIMSCHIPNLGHLTTWFSSNI